MLTVSLLGSVVYLESSARVEISATILVYKM